MKLLIATILIAFPILSQSQTFTEVIKASAFDRAEEDRMGYAVDISGDYAIVGAYGDDFGELNPNMGSAYVFEKMGIKIGLLFKKSTIQTKTIMTVLDGL